MPDTCWTDRHASSEVLCFLKDREYVGEGTKHSLVHASSPTGTSRQVLAHAREAPLNGACYQGHQTVMHAWMQTGLPLS
jgi:hypothetical protein